MFKKINDSFKEKINKPLLTTSFIIYLIIVLWIILFKCAIPFLCRPNKWFITHSISEAIKNTLFYLSFKASIPFTLLDIVCNLLILIPLGLYLPVLFSKKNIFRDVVITIIVVLSIETIQLLTRIGQFSLIDLLLNTSGMLIGEFLYFKFKLTNQVINYIQLFVVIIFLPVFIYAIISIPLNWTIFAPIFDYQKYPYMW